MGDEQNEHAQQPEVSPSAPTPAVHPIWPSFRQYLLQRLKSPVSSPDLMCDFYFTQMETRINSDAAARELAAALLHTAYNTTFDHLQAIQERATDAATRDALELAQHRAKTLAFAYTELDEHISRTVSWKQTRIRLRTRRHLDGVAALLQNHQQAVTGLGREASADAVLVDAIVKRVTEAWADRTVDDTTPRMTLAKNLTGGSVVELGCGVQALLVYKRLELDDGVPDLDETGQPIPASYAYGRAQVAPDSRFGNMDSHRVGVRLAQEFCEANVREIAEGPLAERIAVDHPTWSHGFYVDIVGRLQVLPVRLDTLVTVDVEFEECAFVNGSGRSSDLAYFVASVVITLGTRVAAAVTGMLGAVDDTMAVLAVESVDHKLAAAAKAGTPIAVIPRRKNRSAEKNASTPPGVTVLEVDTPLDALWRIFELVTAPG